MSSKDPNSGGLSVQTLVIASLSSLAAALFVHKFWQAGAIYGAAVTPVIVALVSEALRRPAQVISTKTGRMPVEPPPVVTESRRDDPYGIWEEQRRPRRRLHVGLALATGLVAFAIAAFFLTGAELVLGGASNTDRFRFVPGKQEKRDSGRDAPASTQPEETTPAPEDEEEAPPEETTPEEEPPAETVPEEAPRGETTPEDAAPIPEPPATTPVP